jgi:transposase InsO family protein
VRPLSESPDSHAPASRQRHAIVGRCSAAETQILNQSVELNVRSSEFNLIHHSDRGGQYLSAAYVSQLAEHGIRSSVGRPGTCFDNAAAETFFATLKKQLHRSVWPTRQHARSAIFHYFHYVEGFYNRFRRHSTLNYQSPADFEADHLAATLAT